MYVHILPFLLLFARLIKIVPDISKINETNSKNSKFTF